MKKYLVFALVSLLVFSSGCRKKVNENAALNMSEVSVNTHSPVPVFISMKENAVVVNDTKLYSDYNFTTGDVDLIKGETVVLIGQGENSYVAVYDDKKGYVSGDAVEIIDDSSKSTVGNINDLITTEKQTVIVKEEISEEVKEEIITETVFVPSPTVAQVTTTTAAPPETLYTTSSSSRPALSSSFINKINGERAKANLGELFVDSGLSAKAKYYCESFEEKGYVYYLDDYAIQATGKLKDSKKISSTAKSIVSYVNGFDSNSTKRIGVSVVEGSEGELYYCILAK